MILLLRLYEALNIFQQAHYHSSYLKCGFKHYIKRYVFPIIFLVLVFINKGFIIGFFINSIIGYRFKKRLFFTKRVIRLIITLLLLYSIFILNIYIYFLTIILSDFIVLLANIINSPIEKKIYKIYKMKASEKLHNYQGIKIAVGGSYGKTTTKDFLADMINKPALKTKESYNTPMGIAITANELNNIYDYFICEIGANKEHDIDELLEMIDPDITILNSIGPQHLEGFKTMDSLINEKMKIINNLDYNKVAFANVENEYIRNSLGKTKCMVITYGDGGMYHLKENNNSYDVYYQDSLVLNFETKIKGKHNLNNILACVAVLDYLEIDKNYLKEKIYQLKPSNHRCNIIDCKDYKIIDSSFNANLIGSIEAIKLLDKNKYIITPGFVELQSESKSHHEQLALEIMKNNVIPILIKGNDIKYMIDAFDNNKYPYYVSSTFKKGYSLFKSIKKDESSLLILNDLPDNY